ncbi:MAG: flagellin [Synergistaceae bacterium]|nr:flagellin [Synergistaceae bacterium]
MVVNNNIPALKTYGIVNSTSNELQKSIQKLSTGLRINSAADDAAGLSISEKMRAQINGLDRAVANAQDGVSLIQTAEGALAETHSILQRMRELSVQAANDTLTQRDRSYIQEEVDLLRDEIDHIGNTTTFNTKKILNGDAAVLWSSDKLTTKAIVSGGLLDVDQFGQKKSAEGNYNIQINTSAGVAEVQKSDVFIVKHPDLLKYRISDEDKIVNVTSEGLDFTYNSQYTLTNAANVSETSPAELSYYGDATFANVGANGGAVMLSSVGNGNGGTQAYGTMEAVITLKSFTASTTSQLGAAVVTVEGFYMAGDGTVYNFKEDEEYTLETRPYSSTQPNRLVSGQIIHVKDTDGNDTPVVITTGGDDSRFGTNRYLTEDMVGSKSFFVQRRTGDSTGDFSVTVKGDAANALAHTYGLGSATSSNSVAGKDVTLNQLDFDSATGEVTKSSITLSFTDDTSQLTRALMRTSGTLAAIGQYHVGDTAEYDVKLYDVDKFWDDQGNFMLEAPQTITITQGNGKKASVTLYAHDTLGDVAKKFNNAIANDLGQAAYVDDPDKFVTFVSEATDSTSEAVKGTFVIRSAVAGKGGTLRFSSKNEDLLNAFSLNTIQESTESTYDVTITDAHTGKTVVDAKTLTGNILDGALHKNIAVEFDAMSGINAVWDDANKRYNYQVASGGANTTLHLSDNTTVFHIGANESEAMGIDIGDMRSHALGLDAVLVTDKASAANSITIIDSAIDKVNTQRAKLGAYQNRLEHTMNNLAESSENLTSSRSRIVDTDVAKEMMNFTKNQILLQAGNSMLAQANQLKESIANFIR